MANHASHAALPFCVKGARYTLMIPYLDDTGNPTNPASPDTEVSLDNATATDAAEEITGTDGIDGMSMLTLSGAETNCSIIAIAATSASLPPMLLEVRPRVLPVLYSGTLAAGTSSGGTFPSGVPAIANLLIGCIVKTTGGTGGGGTGGASNQARVITAMEADRDFSVSPNWETTPSTDTTFEVLVTDNALVRYSDLRLIAGDASAAQNQSYASLGIVSGLAVTGTLSSTQMTTDLTEATDDHYKNRALVWLTGTLAGTAVRITAYLGSSKRFTYSTTPTSESPANGDRFIVV